MNEKMDARPPDPPAEGEAARSGVRALPGEVPPAVAAAAAAGAGWFWSGKRLAEITGLTDRRHRQLAEAGYFPPPQRGRYAVEATVLGLFRYFREQLEKKDDSLAKEDLKLKRAKREKTEEELARMRGETIRRDEIGPALRNLALHQRATLQHVLEQEVGPNMAGKTAVEMLEEHKRAVDKICRVFEEGVASWVREGEELTDGDGAQGTGSGPQGTAGPTLGR